jgi:hypothetical protein
MKYLVRHDSRPYNSEQGFTSLGFPMKPDRSTFLVHQVIQKQRDGDDNVLKR